MDLGTKWAYLQWPLDASIPNPQKKLQPLSSTHTNKLQQPLVLPWYRIQTGTKMNLYELSNINPTSTSIPEISQFDSVKYACHHILSPLWTSPKKNNSIAHRKTAHEIQPGNNVHVRHHGQRTRSKQDWSNFSNVLDTRHWITPRVLIKCINVMDNVFNTWEACRKSVFEAQQHYYSNCLQAAITGVLE